MSERRIRAFSLPTTQGAGHYVDVAVRYDEGGICYPTYKQKPRGFYLSVSPIERGDGFERFALFSGSTMFVEEAKRFNAKRLQQLAAEARNLPQYAELLQIVLKNNNITLAEPAAVPAVA